VGFRTMAKKKKITRKELLKKEDEFISLSTRAAQYASAHVKQIQYVAYSIMIIAIIAMGIGLYIRHVNKKALAAYNLAYRGLVSESSAETPEEGTTEISVEALDGLIRKYGRTKTAALAVPQLAYLKFDQGEYDEAISLYQAYLKRDTSGSIYASMAHFGLAAAYEAKGEHEPAITYLKKVVDGGHGFLKEEAMFSLGRVYAVSGQVEMARQVFQDFVNQFEGSPLLPLAKANLGK